MTVLVPDAVTCDGGDLGAPGGRDAVVRKFHDLQFAAFGLTEGAGEVFLLLRGYGCVVSGCSLMGSRDVDGDLVRSGDFGGRQELAGDQRAREARLRPGEV